MDGPSSWHKLMQAYGVIAIGVLALIVMFDAKTRRSQENRLALILGTSGCPKMMDYKYLKGEARELAGDVRQTYKGGKAFVQKGMREGMGGCCSY